MATYHQVVLRDGGLPLRINPGDSAGSTPALADR